MTLYLALRDAYQRRRTKLGSLHTKLAMGADDTSTWLQRLRRLVHPHYRDAAIDPVQLEEVLEDFGSPVSARAAAAVALMAVDRDVGEKLNKLCGVDVVQELRNAHREYGEAVGRVMQGAGEVDTVLVRGPLEVVAAVMFGAATGQDRIRTTE